MQVFPHRDQSHSSDSTLKAAVQFDLDILLIPVILIIHVYEPLTRRKPFSPDQLDTYWENLVLALIGETIDVGDEICGCRVVDKSSKKGKRAFIHLMN